MVFKDILMSFPSISWTDTQILLLFFTIFLLISEQLRNRKPKNFPPGPTCYPFLGNFLSLDAEQLHLQLTKMSKTYGDIFRLRLGGIHYVVVNSYTLVKEALIDQADTFSGRSTNAIFKHINKFQGLAMNNGYSWKQQRRFTLSTLRNFGVGKKYLEPSIKEEFNILCQAIRNTKGEPFNAYHLISNAVSNIICSLVFGRRFEYTDKKFLKIILLLSKGLKLDGTIWTQLYNSFPNLMDLLPGPHKEMISCFKQVCNFITEEIKAHHADLDPSSPRDFIDCYLTEIEKRTNDPEAGFHEEGLCYTVLDLFVAGTETTATTLLWSFIYMMKFPEIQEKVQAEIDRVIGQSRQPCMADRPNMPYTDAVIHEIQRMGNILPLNVPRCTYNDTTLGGYFIPKGTQIIPNLTSVLFDETQWKSPHSFDPQNFLNPQGEFIKPEAFLPFSAGKRICPGESLTRMELFLFFTSILQVFTLSPPAGTKPSLEFELGITLSPKPFKMTARLRWQSCSQRERVSVSQ
ncbi:cytochrome P450 2J2-like [Brachyhypopomus gauderio]|uniref:cytochrome P450 2J2-like n=1 Tax=Brachyhypopomus gauderio TaxID=698409 RepID=UPI00404346A8